MKRSTLVWCAAAALGVTTAGAHAVDWFDGFEAYAVGSDIVGQGGWAFWDGSTSSPSGRVTAAPDPVFAGTKSLEIMGGANPDDIVQTFNETAGFWEMAAYQFIPNANTGTTYYILLNSFDFAGTTNNWSTQIQMNMDNDFVQSDTNATQLPLVTGQWVRIRVLIDLTEDTQTMYYNNELLDAGSWTEGISGGGAAQIQCLDLWADTTPQHVYYDDCSLTQLSEEGACCLSDGSCQGPVSRTNCEQTLMGRYQGHGTECASVNCPIQGPNGWIIDAPFTFCGTTVGAGNDCALVASQDEQWEITIPWDGLWTFSLCAGTQWNTTLFLGSTVCTFDIAFDLDSCGGGYGASVIENQPLTAGTYYLTLEGNTSSLAGDYCLVVSSPCIIERPPGSTLESEPCGQDMNGGCNMTVPTFEQVAVNQVYYGTAWHNGDPVNYQRDTDWYEIVTTTTTTLIWTATGEFPISMGYVPTDPPGTGDCSTVTGISPFSVAQPCGEASVEVTVDAGIHWFFVGPRTNTSEPVDCADPYGPHYAVALTEGASQPCPWDINGDGQVAVEDLLALLATWGPCPPPPASCPADFNGDGQVAVEDLLALLANWGPCP